MKLNSVAFKLGTSIMVLFIALLLCLGIFIDNVFLQIYSNQVHREVNDISIELTESVQPFDRSIEPSEFYDKMARITDTEIVAFNHNGVIISNTTFSFTQNELIPKELLQILREGMHFERSYEDMTNNEEYFYVGRPIMEQGIMTGGVFVFSSVNEINQIMNNIRNWIVGSLLLTLLLAFIYTLFVSKKLSKPLIEMEKATKEIARGNLNTEVNINTNDELGSLGRAINDLSVQLHHYRTNRSELLANISHELRTPMSYLKGYASVINNHQYKNKHDLEVYSSIIVKESDRLSKLINDLFELSKMEEGEFQLTIQKIDLEDMFDSVVSKVKLKATNKNLLLEIINDRDEWPTILSDGRKLEQILLNLLENAISYTEQGKITLSLEEKENHLFIRITDTGIGIPSDQIPFIFDRFHRVEKSRSRESGGTGLGLAIVRELLTQLNGSIYLESEVEQGTTFTLIFPRVLQKGHLNNKRKANI